MRHFPNDHFSVWPFCWPFWRVIAIFEIFICELCHLQASWLKTLLAWRRWKYPALYALLTPNHFFHIYIYICMCSAELLSKELSRENLQWRKEIHTAYKYTSISWREGKGDEVNRTWELRVEDGLSIRLFRFSIDLTMMSAGRRGCVQAGQDDSSGTWGIWALSITASGHKCNYTTVVD